MEIWTSAGLLLLAIMTTAFIVALAVRDNSIVDVVYGLAFVLTGWTVFYLYGSGHSRQWLVLTLLTLWGVRLAGHISLRKRGKGEDFRYRQWREAWGSSFVWRSFLQIFLLQGSVIYLVALPIWLVIRSPGGDLGLLDLLGVAIWSFGFGFEALGDWQLLKFKRDPANRGRIIRSGLWRYTRHPNYFGEATLWWGLFLIALGVPMGGVAILSPLLMAFLLLKVSGIPMLEAKYAGNPEFEQYRAQTNAFFPWFPK